MYKSIILPSAKEDIRDAAIWYNEQKKGLGKRFIREVREVDNYIRQNPKICSIRYEKIRTAVLSIFPFMVHYVIDEEDKTILIISVLHTSWNPKIWKER
jgi:plasmid stabilization system protein ParE